MYIKILKPLSHGDLGTGYICRVLNKDYHDEYTIFELVTPSGKRITWWGSDGAFIDISFNTYLNEAEKI